MGRIIIYSLIGCPYSEAAESTLIKNEISHEVKKIEWSEKTSCKERNKMNTFPQIFYETSNGEQIKIGGNDSLNKILSLIDMGKETKNSDGTINMVQETLDLNRKDALRIIQSLNKI